MIGEQILHYKITRLIGEGGMASVYEAVHEKLQTKVAVKVLNPILTANSNIRQRFENEARFMASLNHVNITRVIDYEERPEFLAIVLEFLEGEDLSVMIKRNGPMNPEKALSVFTQVLDAFEYAHKKNIVHRDVKPSNIFIEPSGEVKILDFGIAKLVGSTEDMTVTGTQIGTPVYMSPEQVNTEKTLDHRSDIYSLGVTLFYMLQGKPPYDVTTTSSFQIYTKIVYEPLPELTGYPEIDKILRVATHKDPAMRYQSCAEFRKALNAVFQHKPEPATAGNAFADDDKTLVDFEPVRPQQPVNVNINNSHTRENQVINPAGKKPDLPEKPKTMAEKPKETTRSSFMDEKPEPAKNGKKWLQVVVAGVIVMAAIVSILLKFQPGFITNIFDSESKRQARQAEVNKLLEYVRTEVVKNPDVINYDSILIKMNQAIDLDENNPEAWMYLGEATYRSATRDGLDLTGLSWKIIDKASASFERVLEINPEYNNPKYYVDVQARPTILWGEMALHFMAEGKNDSALVAYREGKKRGGFTDAQLEYARNTLNSCDQNALLINSFDLAFHPLMYLQKIENVRTDVKPLNMVFFGTEWYFNYMKDKLQLPFTDGISWFRSLEDKTWQTQQYTIDNTTTGSTFSWYLLPDREGKYTRQEQLLCDIIKNNLFSPVPVLISIAFDGAKMIGLGQYLHPQGWTYRLTPEVNQANITDRHIQLIEGMAYDKINSGKINSMNMRIIIDFIRYNYFTCFDEAFNKGDKALAVKIRNLLVNKLPATNSPFYFKELDIKYASMLNKIDYTDDQRLAKEKKDISDYLRQKGLSGITTADGVTYVETVTGTGPKPITGSRVKLNFEMYLLNDTLVSSNKSAAAWEFTLGQKSAIPGLEETIPMMARGGKATILVPSSLGYMSREMANMPAYSTLVFKLELLDVN